MRWEDILVVNQVILNITGVEHAAFSELNCCCVAWLSEESEKSLERRKYSW